MAVLMKMIKNDNLLLTRWNAWERFPENIWNLKWNGAVLIRNNHGSHTLSGEYS